MLTKRFITGVSAAAAIGVFTSPLPLAAALGLAVAPHNPANDYPPLDKDTSKFHAHNAAQCVYSNLVIHIVGPLIATPRRSRKRLEIDVNATSLHTIEVQCPATANRGAFDIFYGSNPVLAWYSRGNGKESERDNYLFAEEVTPSGTGVDPLSMLRPPRDHASTSGELWTRIGKSAGIVEVCSAVIDVLGRPGTFNQLCGMFYDIGEDTVKTARSEGWIFRGGHWGLNVTEITPSKR
ncbi:hypothetical protein FOL46_006950 [Perkinsus olseni]|uniref:Uncharacterized protein n=1 Tax=Perkinsus olseni TaxID=32597 RepID=A0A7J6LGN6_PEROL|nr:hypothetical protein FOL46_006950 [Perkinsus olseni]